MRAQPGYTPREEVAHSLTAALGVGGVLIGVPWLIDVAAMHGGAWRLIGAAAFGLGALLMFGTSTLYHAVRFMC
jgi:hemolysin III